MEPTPKQLAYLRQLAHRTGQTFVPPKTKGQAHSQINRLLNEKRTPAADVRRELHQVQHDMAVRHGDEACVRVFEVDGYGSSASWAQRRQQERQS